MKAVTVNGFASRIGEKISQNTIALSIFPIPSNFIFGANFASMLGDIKHAKSNFKLHMMYITI